MASWHGEAKLRRITRSIALALIVWGGATAHAQVDTPTPTTEAGTVRITSPTEGQSISGTVQIVGSTLHPNFQAFTVSYAPDPAVEETDWTPIQAPVSQQVANSTLAIWDTTAIRDDRYIIRLRVTTTVADTDPVDVFVGVTVSNATATPLATVFAPTTAPNIGPTLGPSPTPFIDMPPTRTPRPSATPGGPTPTPELVVDSPFDPDRLRGAAVRGALVSLVAFGALGLYAGLRTGLRDTLRILWYDIKQWIKGDGRR